MSNEITLLALRLFVEVAATGNFTATAKRRGLPPSSVSRHIQGLEQALGQKLLYRHTRAVTLTDTGVAYLSEVRDALAALDIATDRVAGAASEPRGLLRINAPVAFGRRHIAPLLAGYQARFPQVEVELTLTDAVVDPVAEGMDVTLRIGVLKDSSLTARKLAAQRYVACGSPTYLDSRGRPGSPEELERHNCLLYKGVSGRERWHFRDSTSDFRNHEVHGNLTSNNAESLVEAALQHQGLVLFPTWLLHDNLRAGRLEAVMQDHVAAVDTVVHDIHVIHAENRLRSFKLLSFRDYLFERIGTPPYWDGGVQVGPAKASLTP